jgi:xanthine/CO dehydrogenase XdhC/CoxF family maturation factor
MTHSLEQDTRALSFLLDRSVAYVGVLGPRRRTEQMLESIAAERFGAASTEERVASWIRRFHTPMGLDLGGNTPAAIALATWAEMQQSLHDATGKPLGELRASSHSVRSEIPV